MTRIEWLGLMSRMLPSSPVVVEIGVLRGTFSKQILKALSPRTFAMVDAWTRFPPAEFEDYQDYTQEKWDSIYERVVERFEPEDSVRIVRDLSARAAKQFEDGFFDLVYVDANHAYDYVVADLHAWYPKLKVGGVMAGHDYDLKDVSRAVHAFLIKEHGGDLKRRVLQSTSELSCQTYWWTK